MTHSVHKRLKDALSSRKKQMNLRNDERVLSMTDRKQLVHQRNESCSELTRYDTAQGSDTHRLFTSKGR